MSRYQWSGRKKSPDRPLLRARYNAATTGILPAGAVSAVRAAAESIPSFAPTGDANLWVPIGPSTVLKGQAGMKPRVAGRVRDIRVAANGLRAYVATANGGVWVTFDAGNSWSPLGNWLHPTGADDVSRPATTLTCGCLLVNFDDTKDNGAGDEIYAGTGEIIPDAAGLPGRRLGGVGILRLDKPVPDVLADPFDRHHWKREAKNLADLGIYRLAHHPADTKQMIAGTSTGLFKRSSPLFIEHSDWTRITASPFNFAEKSGKHVTDLLWLGARLFVALVGGSDTDVWTSTNGVDGPYTRLNLPGVVPDGRLALAVAPSDPATVYVLGTGPRLWRVNGVTPTKVDNLPKGLFLSSTTDLSFYAMALDVHPDQADVVSVGGAGFTADGEVSAALCQFKISLAGAGLTTGFLDALQDDPALDASYIGTGVHADVHQIRYVKVGGAVHIWVACDGGVFRSVAAGEQYSFMARNAGLAVLEPGYVACHPENDAYVIAGAQDNGLLMRTGDTVWTRSSSAAGDAGGSLIHPIKNRFFAAQYHNAEWYGNGTPIQPVLRGTGGDSEKNEGKNSFFYSGPDARKVGAAQVRLAIGTNRVWLADSWDPESALAWVTLPTGDDPRKNKGTDESTDTFGDGSGGVIACKWIDDNRLAVLVRSGNLHGKNSGVFMMRHKNDGKWERVVLSSHSNKSSDFSNSDIEQPVSEYLPPLGPWSDIAVHDPARGNNGSLYAAVTGDGSSDRMDTLWWYDGTSKWYPTTLRSSILGTKAPAYAVVVDPADNTAVYAGTALGVWKGTLSFTGSDPHWDWTAFSNGLPETVVQDLSFYSKGNIKLLRAALQARGVWEVDLSAAPGPTKRTFLRVHPNDARRQSPTALANPMKDGPGTWLWFSSPDLRIRPAPLAPADAIPTPTGLPWAGAATDPYLLWVFQTALHAIDPLCRPTGLWDNQFSQRLRKQKPGAGSDIDATRWGEVVTRANAFATPWEGTEPSEADLYELVVERPRGARDTGVAPPFISHVDARRYFVDVLVHYRDLRPLSKDQVRVALFLRPLTDNQGTWPTTPITDDWRNFVVQTIAGGAPQNGPDTWKAADSTSPSRILNSDIDARTPRAVTFSVDFTGLNGKYAVLLAAVHSNPDPLSVASLTGATLQDLVLNCHQVAVRIVHGV